MPDLPMIAPGYGEEDVSDYEDLSSCLSNTCVIDRSVLTESLRAALDHPFFRVLRILEPALMVLCLGMLIWTIATHKGTGPAVLIGLVLAAVAAIYWAQFIRYPKKSIHDQILRQVLEDGTDALTNRLWFTEANVANRRGNRRDVLHMSYDRIKRVYETRRLIVLTTRRNRLIPLDKAGFENGSAEDLYRLLAVKAPNAKTERRTTNDPGR